jgi:hypothetical protein
MTDWRTLLRDVNARQDEEQLSADEAESIRRAVLAVASTAAPEPRVWPWMRPMMVAATVTAVIVAGVVAGHRFDVSTPPASPAVQGGATSVDDQTVPATVPNRQLQFLTPGGTRIIWVFNSEFDLKATVR